MKWFWKVFIFSYCIHSWWTTDGHTNRQNHTICLVCLNMGIQQNKTQYKCACFMGNLHIQSYNYNSWFCTNTTDKIVTNHYSDIIMGMMASQTTSLMIVYSTAYSDQRKYQSSASLAFVRGIHRWPVNCPHKWPVTWKMFPFDDVIMHKRGFCT